MMANQIIRETKSERGGVNSRPLYAQVHDVLLERISSGTWQPGELIPNEFAIAKELGVSQGTIRKALDALAADHVLVRRQGRGTYVAQHTPADMLFRFFNFFDANGQRIQPESWNTRLSEGRATREERKRLMLDENAKVFRISRIRGRNAEPFIFERIILPETLFKGLSSENDLPNTLYDHFQKTYGVTIARGTEWLTVTSAGPKEAKALHIAEGTPLLKLDRIAYSLQNQPVEWRASLCRMDETSYVVKLS
jgi:GntR family transcriptional regulator